MSENNFTLDLNQLRDEVGAWAQENFPQTAGVTYHPAMGLVEEFGELNHALLKLEQGIRGDKEDHIENAKDAIGDMVIYLADLLYRLGSDADWRPLESPGYNPENKEMFEYLNEILSDIWYIHTDVTCVIFEDSTSSDLITRAAGVLIKRLIEFCEFMGWDLQEIIEDTWDFVGERNWVENPVSG